MCDGARACLADEQLRGFAAAAPPWLCSWARRAHRPSQPQTPALTAVRVSQTQVRATVAPTLAPRAVAPPAENLPLATVLDESFAAPSLDWPADRAATAWLADGALHLNARDPGHFVALGLPGGDQFRDVIVTAQFRKEGGPPGGGFGIIVGDTGPGPRDGVAQDGQYVVVEVGDQGTLGVWQRQDDHWVDLRSWTESLSVRRGGEQNELTVRAVVSPGI